MADKINTKNYNESVTNYILYGKYNDGNIVLEIAHRIRNEEPSKIELDKIRLEMFKFLISNINGR